MKRLRFGILGCGAVLKKHLAAHQILDGATELCALCDINEDAAKKAGEEAGLPYFTDARKMVDEAELDVVTILTPSGLHAQCLLDIVDTGVHFVVEKPLTLRLRDADTMIRECDKHGSKLFVVQQNRFNPPIVALKNALDQGRFGKLVMGKVEVCWKRDQAYYDSKGWRGTWKYDGGVLANQASHHVDMLAWLMGDVQSVYAMTATRLAAIEAEDTAVAVLRFEHGALGAVEATTATRPSDIGSSLRIMGEGGHVEIGGPFMNVLEKWSFADERPEDAAIFETHGSVPKIFAWNHAQYLNDVAEAINGLHRGLVEGFEGRNSLELLTSLYESAVTQSEVHLRFNPKHAKLGI